jgi:WD40 repeat protein
LDGHLLHFSPDGQLLVLSGDKKTIELWSLSECTLIKTLERNISKSDIFPKCSPDGQFLIIGNKDSGTELWSLPECILIKTWQKDSGRFRCFSPDGQLLVFFGDNRTIELWSLPECTLIKTLESIGNVTLSSKGELLSINKYETIELWSLPDGVLIKTLEKSERYNDLVAFSPDEHLFVTVNKSGFINNTIKLWTLPDGEWKTCLMDLACSPPSAKGVTYTGLNEYGQAFSYTLPCGSPIPSGATCTCNCVPGTYQSGSGKGTICSCDEVCTCVPVYY